MDVRQLRCVAVNVTVSHRCRYHHAPHIPVVTAKWLDAGGSTLRFFHIVLSAAYNSPPFHSAPSRWCWLPTEPYKTKWKEDVPCTQLLPSSPIVVQACGRRPSSSTFASCLCRLGVGICMRSSCIRLLILFQLRAHSQLYSREDMYGLWNLPVRHRLPVRLPGQSSAVPLLVMSLVT